MIGRQADRHICNRTIKTNLKNYSLLAKNTIIEY